jgi:hypothetical protein
MGLFRDALAFPFREYSRLFWFWIVVIPVFGWIAYAGYMVDVMRAVFKGKEKLPPFGELWPTMKTGLLYLVVAMLVNLIANMLLWIPYIGWLLWFVSMLFVPIMILQFAITGEFRAGFDAMSAMRRVFGNFKRYCVYMLCIAGITAIWILASLPIITALLTLPAMAFGSSYLLARFYRETE